MKKMRDNKNQLNQRKRKSYKLSKGIRGVKLKMMNKAVRTSRNLIKKLKKVTLCMISHKMISRR